MGAAISDFLTNVVTALTPVAAVLAAIVLVGVGLMLVNTLALAGWPFKWR